MSVEKNELIFACTRGTIVVSREDACIRVLNDRNIRVFNKEYEFLYVRFGEISALLDCLEKNGYQLIDTDMREKPVALLKQDFTKELLILILGFLVASMIYIVLFRAGLI